MSVSPCPILTAVSGQQRHHELRREATAWHAVTRAAAAPTPQPAGNPPHAGTVSRLAVSWHTRVARRLRFTLPTHPAPGAETWSQG